MLPPIRRFGTLRLFGTLLGRSSRLYLPVFVSSKVFTSSPPRETWFGLLRPYHLVFVTRQASIPSPPSGNLVRRLVRSSQTVPFGPHNPVRFQGGTPVGVALWAFSSALLLLHPLDLNTYKRASRQVH